MTQNTHPPRCSLLFLGVRKKLSIVIPNLQLRGEVRIKLHPRKKAGLLLRNRVSYLNPFEVQKTPKKPGFSPHPRLQKPGFLPQPFRGTKTPKETRFLTSPAAPETGFLTSTLSRCKKPLKKPGFSTYPRLQKPGFLPHPHFLPITAILPDRVLRKRQNKLTFIKKSRIRKT